LFDEIKDNGNNLFAIILRINWVCHNQFKLLNFMMFYNKKDLTNTHVGSVGALVFSVEAVFSYSVVDRRGIIPPMCPTVRALVLFSNLDAVVLGLAGLKMLSKSEIHNH
jgi:hypothetical protein